MQTNLIEAYDQLVRFCEKWLPDAFVLDGMQLVSARELAANSFMHREYLSPYMAMLEIGAGFVRTRNVSRALYSGPVGRGLREPWHPQAHADASPRRAHRIRPDRSNEPRPQRAVLVGVTSSSWPQPPIFRKARAGFRGPRGAPSLFPSLSADPIPARGVGVAKNLRSQARPGRRGACLHGQR